ncbi:hypothetical protein [Streptomyces sp. NPDC006333]|uniref:hypothetical protein n=1 Tax=unclassified Streptomyces TaxID=2593676 RepID=UPI0033AC16F0
MAAAEWTTNLGEMGLLRPVGLLPITLFGLFVVASSAPLLRIMTRPYLSCTTR